MKAAASHTDLMGDAVTLPGLEPPTAQPAAGDLVDAANVTIEALRAQNAIQPWHELDCAIVVEAARGVTSSRGIAKSQMVSALLQARAKLPEPVVVETDEAVQYEADRVEQWLRAHTDPAELPDPAEPAPVH